MNMFWDWLMTRKLWKRLVIDICMIDIVPISLAWALLPYGVYFAVAYIVLLGVSYGLYRLKLVGLRRRQEVWAEKIEAIR